MTSSGLSVSSKSHEILGNGIREMLDERDARRGIVALMEVNMLA